MQSRVVMTSTLFSVPCSLSLLASSNASLPLLSVLNDPSTLPFTVYPVYSLILLPFILMTQVACIFNIIHCYNPEDHKTIYLVLKKPKIVYKLFKCKIWYSHRTASDSRLLADATQLCKRLPKLWRNAMPSTLEVKR
jgi:hypothetical protein